MFSKLFSKLQRVGQSFMIPIAVLPVAGLLMGIGQSFTNETMIQTYHSMHYSQLCVVQAKLFLITFQLYLR